jgi:hypothetical protein
MERVSLCIDATLVSASQVASRLACWALLQLTFPVVANLVVCALAVTCTTVGAVCFDILADAIAKGCIFGTNTGSALANRRTRTCIVTRTAVACVSLQIHALFATRRKVTTSFGVFLASTNGFTRPTFAL